MFRNYLKTALRIVTRNKAFSIINILGLALGIATSLLIYLWVQDERNTDTFNTTTIFDVYERVFSEGKVDAGPAAPGLLANELKKKIPEIKYSSGFWNTNDEMLFSAGDKNINQKGAHADSDFFKMFNYPLIEGSARLALNTPDAIAISNAMAVSFFGSPSAAIGKTLRYNNSEDFRVMAVFDLPANASNKFDYVLNWNHQLKSVDWLSSWIYRSPFTFIELQDGADAKTVSIKIKDFLSTYLTAANKEGGGFRTELGLQRFNDMYLHSTFKNATPYSGRIEYVRLFIMVAVFILLIACVNFMNLATARSVQRAKEVGIRKTIGAMRSGLIVQFIGEAMLLTALAFAIAFVLVVFLLPYFNRLTNKQIVLPLSSFTFWIKISGLMCLTGFIAGSYPALFLSSLNPVKVLKGALRFSNNALVFRKGLVVFQFVLSIVMITGTIIISQQIRYVQTTSLGFDRKTWFTFLFRAIWAPGSPFLNRSF